MQRLNQAEAETYCYPATNLHYAACSKSVPFLSSIRIPPVVIPDNWNYAKLLQYLCNALYLVKIEAKYPGSLLKILVSTFSDFRTIQDLLTKEQVSFQTFALPQEREIKVVLSGIPSHTFPKYIRQKLVALGYSPTAVPILHVG